MTEEQDDPALGPDDQVAISALTPLDVAAIDQALVSHCDKQWRKVAYVVAMAMNALQHAYLDVPDIYYAERVRTLVADGLLEGQGDVRGMRFSEVRLCV
ncbi:DUF3658 domain-containing protein [Noviluteimonas gilva]|uniref:DUF3658 domain-containing protein n=1 Tax=Noviluteimonas gilva TaxID=2682097 RepID=A0A7C9HML8_9GAMM|nr:DUF3658 domain-containing protein [Lysobacter gilvus]MUV14530.1 hypothetical protein [Lysobacter gilvus]